MKSKKYWQRSLEPCLGLTDYLELLREMEEKDRRIAALHGAEKIAIEAIDRYCPPELRQSAEKWLESKLT